MTLVDVAACRAESDPGFAKLLADLPAAWADVPSDEDGLELVAAFLRAAYGHGYMTALEGGVSERRS